MDKIIDYSRFEQEGLLWEEYLKTLNRSSEMHKKRYRDVSEEILKAFGSIDKEIYAVILTDESCGDCAWAIPRIVRVFENAEIEYRLFSRNIHPDLQEKMKTKGKKSVPKLILLSEKWQLLGEWGPRPANIQSFVEKSVNVVDRKKWYPKVLEYYRNEGENDLFRELIELLNSIA